MKTIFSITLCLLFLYSCKTEPKTEITADQNSELNQGHDADPVLSEAETIAFKNGLENWQDVQQIDFTFNVDRGGKNVAKRSWSWKPKTGDVTMTNGEEVVTYNRSAIDSTNQAADQGFINDKFWLLAPYQLVWDEGTTISVQDTATAPISRKLSKKLTIVYGSEGGYTPGDAYDFYYNEDFIISEWVFREANIPSPSMTTTFEAYQEFDGLNIATSHTNKEGTFKLYFTDIKVTK